MRIVSAALTTTALASVAASGNTHARPQLLRLPGLAVGYATLSLASVATAIEDVSKITWTQEPLGKRCRRGGGSDSCRQIECSVYMVGSFPTKEDVTGCYYATVVPLGHQYYLFTNSNQVLRAKATPRARDEVVSVQFQQSRAFGNGVFGSLNFGALGANMGVEQGTSSYTVNGASKSCDWQMSCLTGESVTCCGKREQWKPWGNY